eukprot:GHVP01053165.1.p1 GENE.GHVP01053165.1~~GHVP01053165.1.p1  ORF type:complete len:309 (-),score=63.93 GHVP01053165.1:99-1025(-)
MPEITNLKAGIIGTFITTVNGVPSALSSEATEVPCSFQDEVFAKGTESPKPKPSYFRGSLGSTIGNSSLDSVECEDGFRAAVVNMTRLQPQKFAPYVANKLELLDGFSLATMKELLENYDIGERKCKFGYEDVKYKYGGDFESNFNFYGYRKKATCSNPKYPDIITMTSDNIEGSIFMIFEAPKAANSWIITSSTMVCTTFKLADHDDCTSLIQEYLPALLKSGPKKFQEFNNFQAAEGSDPDEDYASQFNKSQAAEESDPDEEYEFDHFQAAEESDPDEEYEFDYSQAAKGSDPVEESDCDEGYGSE